MSVSGEEEVEDAELRELCRDFGVEELYEGLLAKKVTVDILKNADLMDIEAFLPSDATRVIFKSHWRKWKAALPDSLNPEGVYEGVPCTLPECVQSSTSTR
uniref:Uncharacterized protein n=1 Tax=Phlebotomus papatasi TaxID=29031 RepID=A0A1B0D3W6_PHLPP